MQSDVRVFSIVGGPGYGKTVAAARMYANFDVPKAWYGLDDSDADVASFAAHLNAALDGIAGIAPVFGDPARVASPKELGRTFAERLGELGSALIVFDDVHTIEGSDAARVLGEFVERAARIGVTFVLCGRSIPVPLHAFAAAGTLAQAGPADLGFNEAQALAFFARATGAHDHHAGLLRLARRAEGWPAGLALLAAGSGGVAATVPVAHDDAGRRLLFDYLAREVVDALSAEERAFLLETSILERLEATACATVSGRSDARDVLRRLSVATSFVNRRSDEAYTCHGLLRDFLQHELTRTRTRAEIGALHRLAADASSAAGDTVGTIVHRLDAGDVAEAKSALAAAALDLLRAGLVTTVGGLLARLPDATIATNCTLLAARGRVERERGDWDEAQVTLERAIASAHQTHAFDAMTESIRVLAAILASRGEFERLHEHLSAALAYESELPEETQTTLRMTLAAVFVETSRFDEALAIFRDVSPSVVRRGDLAAHGSLLHNSAVALVRRGDMYAAVAMYERALKVKRNAGQRVAALLTLGDLVYARMLLGDLDEAEASVEELVVQARDIGPASLVAHALENVGMLHLERENFAAAELAFEEALATCDCGDTLVLPDIQHGLARCALMRGDIDAADELCATAASIFRRVERKQQTAPILLTRGRCALASGDAAGALAFAREALVDADAGADAVLNVATTLDTAAFVVELAESLAPALAAECDGIAAAAAARSIALIHARDYRFIVRTKAPALARLERHLRRWGIGSALARTAHPVAPAMTIAMFGGLRVAIGGHDVPRGAWKRRKARDMFAYLVNARGRAVPRSKLMDAFWPDIDADAAHENLRVTISAIRRAAGDVVKYDVNAYRFEAPPGTVLDVERFERHIEAAQNAVGAGETTVGLHHYEAAVALYAGDFLDGMEDVGWQWRDRERLRAMVIEALRCVAAERTTDQPIEARLILERLLELAPYDLDAVRARLDLLVREMRLGDARRSYEAWRDDYRAAIGVDAPAIWEMVVLPG